ncbi:polyprenyl synthetase family protein [candidate division KSB1 bacterium]|nr:polyprenyl synthetase family protein [candidate division KSB1 bacterium]
MTLEKICEPIQFELETFEKEFKLNLSSDVLLLNQIVEYIVSHSGKRLRPILVFLSANLIGKPSKATMQAAILAELLHTATLLHDDVVDESDLRRGVATVNAIWQNKVAILSGDYLFAKVLEYLVTLKQPVVFEILAKVTQRMSAGELLQIERKQDYYMPDSIYYRLIADKTASLIAASCQLGGITALPSQNGERFDYLSQMGEYLGIAFQIKDDLLDYMGDKQKTGKPTGNDILENKITLPLLYALRTAPTQKSQQVIDRIDNSVTDADLSFIQNFVTEFGGLDYARSQANHYIQLAHKMIQDIQDSPYKASLIALAEYIVQREK